VVSSAALASLGIFPRARHGRDGMNGARTAERTRRYLKNRHIQTGNGCL